MDTSKQQETPFTTRKCNSFCLINEYNLKNVQLQKELKRVLTKEYMSYLILVILVEMLYARMISLFQTTFI